MVQLLKQKCLPILLYALEVCNLNKRILQSLDFTVNRFFMKLFRASNIIGKLFANYGRTVFGCELHISLLLVKDMRNLLRNLQIHLFSCSVKLFSFLYFYSVFSLPLCR